MITETSIVVYKGVISWYMTFKCLGISREEVTLGTDSDIESYKKIQLK